MDSQTTLQQLKDVALAFRDERDWAQFHTPKDLAVALSIEAAELLEHFRFKDDEAVEEYLAEAENRRAVSYELADLLIFIFCMSDRLGIDLSQAYLGKMKICAERYPPQLVRGSSRKYTEWAGEGRDRT
jgi:dCTP diphosphatase